MRPVAQIVGAGSSAEWTGGAWPGRSPQAAVLAKAGMQASSPRCAPVNVGRGSSTVRARLPPPAWVTGMTTANSPPLAVVSVGRGSSVDLGAGPPLLRVTGTTSPNLALVVTVGNSGEEQLSPEPWP